MQSLRILKIALESFLLIVCVVTVTSNAGYLKPKSETLFEF